MNFHKKMKMPNKIIRYALIVLLLFVIVELLIHVGVTINNYALIDDLIDCSSTSDYTFSAEQVHYFVFDLFLPINEICLLYSILLIVLIVSFLLIIRSKDKSQ